MIVSLSAFGQAARSPFSTLGVGEIFGGALIQHQGMGGTGVAQPQFWAVNNQNPALLINNYFTTFQAGALVESRTFKNDSASQKSTDGNLNYLVTAFPVMRSKKNPNLMFWTTSVSLLPFSKVNYRLTYVDSIQGVTDNALLTVESGSGGLSQVSWANGFRITPELSVGLKASYIFGSTVSDYANRLIVSDQSVPFIVGIRDQSYMKDFLFTGGLAFAKDSLFNDNIRINFGLTYAFATGLKTNTTTVQQRRLTTQTPITSDTLISRNGTVNIPSALTIGFAVSKGIDWAVSSEFSMQDWSAFEGVHTEDEGLRKSWRMALGGEVTPDQSDFKSYLKRVTYRAGVSFEKTPYANPNVINGKQLNDYGINLGLSLPAGRSSIDTAVRFGK
ncbi:MAG TPA: hypothetical protein VFM90_05365, partial [Cyclobacteriaceae bacterium]|nr:hypothetical protein [Cyclobacteriaceae bacterium]